MRILITGGPTTGKTTLRVELGKSLGYKVINVKKLVKDNPSVYKVKNKEKIVDIGKLEKILKKEIGKYSNVIVESHLLCEMNLKGDYIIVLRAGKKTLEKRMKKRKYSKKKIQENILAELLDYCIVKSKENLTGKIFEVNTSKRSKEKSLKLILNIIKKKTSGDKVDFRKELINFVIGEYHG